MRRVIIESPYSGEVEENVRYARECLFDCLARGEAPFASHLLYTQILDDTNPDQRARGIRAGFEWMFVANYVVVYVDRGISRGMKLGIERARSLAMQVRFREFEGRYPARPIPEYICKARGYLEP
jgi:hypothetical protein